MSEWKSARTFGTLRFAKPFEDRCRLGHRAGNDLVNCLVRWSAAKAARQSATKLLGVKHGDLLRGKSRSRGQACSGLPHVSNAFIIDLFMHNCIDMDLRQLRTFVVVAEAGGFAAAHATAAPEPAGCIAPDPGTRGRTRNSAIRSRRPRDQTDIRGRGPAAARPAAAAGRRIVRRACTRAEDRKAGALRVGCSTQHMETVLADFLPAFRRRHPPSRSSWSRTAAPAFRIASARRYSSRAHSGR